MKRLRHKAIIELIRGGQIGSQEELLEGLQARHIEVSQSTLSRDIQELKLAKSAGYYTVVEREGVKDSSDSLRRIAREFLQEIAVASNIVVLKTGPGHASTLSRALDDARWPEAVGSIAGDDTVFVAVQSPADARKVARRLRDLLE